MRRLHDDVTTVNLDDLALDDTIIPVLREKDRVSNRQQPVSITAVK